MATFDLKKRSNKAATSRGAVVVPMLSRDPDQTDENDLPIANWLGLITDDGVFNLSVDSRSEAADDMRAEAMSIPETPADVGADVTLRGNSVFYEGTKVGTRVGYEGNVIPLGREEEQAVKIVMQMRRSGDLVLTNNRAAGQGSQGLNFKGHGQQFTNNLASIPADHPDAWGVLILYLTYVHLQYMDVVDFDAEEPELTVKPADELSDEQLHKAAEARFLIDEMHKAFAGEAAAEESTGGSGGAGAAAAAAGL